MSLERFSIAVQICKKVRLLLPHFWWIIQRTFVLLILVSEWLKLLRAMLDAVLVAVSVALEVITQPGGLCRDALQLWCPKMCYSFHLSCWAIGLSPACLLGIERRSTYAEDGRRATRPHDWFFSSIHFALFFYNFMIHWGPILNISSYSNLFMRFKWHDNSMVIFCACALHESVVW